MSDHNPSRQYRRSCKGIRIHRAECRYAKRAMPWPYADDFTTVRLQSELSRYPWLRTCRHCLPGVSPQDAVPSVLELNRHRATD